MLDGTKFSGTKIKAAREKHAGLSQAKVAALLGVEPQTVWRWEAEMHQPSGLTGVALARLLDVPLDDLLQREPAEATR